MSITHFANPSMVARLQSFAQIDAIQLGAPSEFAEDVDLARRTKDRAIIGNVGYDTPASDTGAAHIFAYSSGAWALEQTITAPVPVASQGFGFGIAMSGDGSRAVISQTGATIPAQANTYVYDRIGTVWSLTETITTDFSGGNSTQEIRISEDGLTLMLSISFRIKFYRWNGANFILQATFSEAQDYGVAIVLSADGRAAATVRPGQGRLIVFYDSTGLGAWAVRDDRGGVPNATTQPRALAITGGGEHVAFANVAVLNTWRWDGLDYQTVTVNQTLGGISVLSVGISETGTTISVFENTIANTQLYIGDPDFAPVFSKTLSPKNPEQAGSSGVSSYDGKMFLIGNKGWRTSNGQQGRAFSFET